MIILVCILIWIIPTLGCAWMIYKYIIPRGTRLQQFFDEFWEYPCAAPIINIGVFICLSYQSLLKVHGNKIIKKWNDGFD